KPIETTPELTRIGCGPARPNKQIIMQKNSSSESGLFNPRVLIAFALCSAGVLLAMFSFAGMTDSSAGLAVAVAPGFHAPVTVPGSSSGSEPSLAITGDTNPAVTAGIRYVSWQNPGEFNKSADGVNFDAGTTRPTPLGGGDV